MTKSTIDAGPGQTVAAHQPATFQAALEEWSLKRPTWQRHALWLLTTKAELEEDDYNALENCLLKEVGLALKSGDAETLFDQSHLKPKDLPTVRLLGITNFKHVNRLTWEGLTFQPVGLNIVYGENGSGKTGFIRAMRRACRSRIEKPVDLAILANVYGQEPGVASATFKVLLDEKEQSIDWSEDGPSPEALSAFSVFDSRSAQLYVDEGSKLRFLPNDLDLPFRLNEAVLVIEDRLGPMIEQVEELLLANLPPFDEKDIVTGARKFCEELHGEITDEAIDAACSFSENDEADLIELRTATSAQPGRIAELKGKAAAAKALGSRLTGLEKALSSSAANDLIKAAKRRATAFAAHETAKALIEGKDPLPVGSEAWRELWRAAQAYASQVDHTHSFPASGPKGSAGQLLCPLCQQDASGASERLARFDSFMSDQTATELDEADKALGALRLGLQNQDCRLDESALLLIESIRTSDGPLAGRVIKAFELADGLKSEWIGFQGEEGGPKALALEELTADLQKFATDCEALAQTIEQAQDAEKRAELLQRLSELEDQRCLAACSKMLKDRRDHLNRHKQLTKAKSACRRNEVTKQANIWVDTYLSGAAKDLFKAEMKRLKLEHLNIELSRDSTSIGTGYKNNLAGGSNFKRVSDVLSEGEQRALSLAGFFTEAQLERPGGTLIVDDPVSSLDRRRSAAVAEKLAEAAMTRQVIVFTHDLLFLEELCEAAKKVDIDPACQRVFSTPQETGKRDEAGMAWKGQPVKKRLNYLRSKLPALTKLHTASATDYEFDAKHLYGRLREAYERFVEEVLFKTTLVRYRDAVETRMLRYVTVPDAIAIRFHEAFSKCSLHSHDNPQAKDVTPPDPAEILADLDAFGALIDEVTELQKQTEAARAVMK